MEYRRLGRTGLMVSELCLGTMTFGRELDEEGSREIIARFLEAGGNFVDTADVYENGTSEEIVGRAIKDARRDELVLATKIRFPMGDGPNDVGLSRKHILSGCEASLRRLGTDYISTNRLFSRGISLWAEEEPMRPIRIPTLSPEQLDALEELYRTTREARLRRRAQRWSFWPPSDG